METPYVQERWELVAYVNSTVVDSVAQPMARCSDVSGGLNDVYGLGRLSTAGGTAEAPVAATYLADGLGSVSAVLDGSGAVSAAYSYSPWGEASGDAGELPAYGYNAEEATAAAGLQYLRARWYAPGAAAFASRDSYLGSAADPASLNRYAYVQGNPLANADPTGHESRSTRGKVASQVRRNMYNSRRGVGAKGGSFFSRAVSAVSSQARASSPRVAPLYARSMTPQLRAASSPAASLGRSARSVVVKRTALSRAAGSSAVGSARSSARRGILYWAERDRERQRRIACERLPYFGVSPTRGAGDAHVMLDVAGTFDPTPVSDSLNALLYGLEGDAPNAFISLLAAFAPYAGDALKLGRPALKAGGAAADALKLGRAPDSKVLRDNMVSTGVKVPSYDNAAHHIVAGGDHRADEARRVLEKWEIDINDPANGVFLRTTKEVSEGAYHPSVHTNAYYESVNKRLREASGSREDVIQELEAIGRELANGTFIY